MHLCDDKILKNILQLQIFNQVLTAVKTGSYIPTTYAYRKYLSQTIPTAVLFNSS